MNKIPTQNPKMIYIANHVFKTKTLHVHIECIDVKVAQI